MNQNVVKKLSLVLLIATAVTLFFATGLHRHLTLAAIKSSQAHFQEFYAQHAVAMIALFLAVYIPVIALNLPGAVILGLAAGALFGTLTGTVIISFASTVGATLACLLCRYLFRDWVQRKFGDRLQRVNEGIRAEGAFYLFSLRLIPMIPFFIINMVMGLTPIRLWTFYWVSQLGMLPATILFVNAGSQLAQIESLAGIVSPRLIISLALLGLFPLAAKKLLQAYRRRAGCSAAAEEHPAAGQSPALQAQAAKMRSECTECGACRTQCAFLKKHGLPKTIAETRDFSRAGDLSMAYECSLCRLCTAVCPEKLAPADLFLAARREAAAADQADLSRYGAILGYEKRGTSPLFSYYGLPNGCDTIFFPGCSLPGTRPETTWQLFRHLQAAIPNLGIVLDCCTKPSHDLGRQDHFEAMFGEMRAYLTANGIRKVLVACPNCHKMFKQYGDGLAVQTVYEHLAGRDLPEGARVTGEQRAQWTVHDPCPLRGERGAQDAVRKLLAGMGIEVSEMAHSREHTLCCGEGGSVGFIQSDLAKSWGQQSKEEANGRKVVTYCAGCAGFLGRVTPTVHIADLLFNPEQSLNGGLKVSTGPWTYLNRIKLKKRCKETLRSTVSRVRTFSREKLAQAEKDACTPEDCKQVLCRKAVVAAVGVLACVGLLFAVRHFMYILDSYVYTAEFHGMFMQSNLKNENAVLFAQYFQALGPLAGMPNLMMAHLFQNVIVPFARPVLTPAAVQAFGPFIGALLTLLSYLLVAWLAFGVGRYVLGDLLPLLRRTKAPLAGWIYPCLALLLAVPYVPVALPAFLGAVTRARFKSLTLVMAAALTLRLAWELALPAGL
ncbi:MAG: VTT domain-containing protein [Desulfobacterales bacterium]|nr:VTT domain-containing protein [Desulfobacterales bacterium]